MPRQRGQRPFRDERASITPLHYCVYCTVLYCTDYTLPWRKMKGAHACTPWGPPHCQPGPG